MARRPGTATPVRPIAHQSLVDRVTDELHRAILNGDIQPGSAVSIVELCEQFDVSHIPVREALRRLESEGLVSLRPGRSALALVVKEGKQDRELVLVDSASDGEREQLARLGRMLEAAFAQDLSPKGGA